MKTISEYTTYCSEEQTRKALELGAPIETTKRLEPLVNRKYITDLDNYSAIIVPTAEQMMGWMRSKGIQFHFDDETNYWRVSNELEPISISYGNSPKKELSAIDAVLEYMGKQK